MDLEQIKNDKTKEAKELYLKLGLDPEDDSINYQRINEYSPYQPVQIEDPNKKTKLIWTRLSINSNIGCIVE